MVNGFLGHTCKEPILPTEYTENGEDARGTLGNFQPAGGRPRSSLLGAGATATSPWVCLRPTNQA